MANTLQIRKELGKIAELLWGNGENGVVCFDRSSYDLESDIPHLVIDGKYVIVDTFIINKDGSQFTVCDDNKRDSYTLDMDAIPTEWDDNYFIEVGLDALLRDVYYETKESYEIGDYEMDFIGDNE